MTESVLEVFEAIEKAALALNLGNKFGPHEAVGAVAIVANHFGPRWSHIENQLERGEITPTGYLSEALRMIHEYKEHRTKVHAERIERML